ncbi:hypothetical protein WP2W18C05_16600 [Aeromonas sp. WP2-W18-CRE-05]|nr:hypothetical protein WP2W18C05_16600 [Aeromonas sp. WP2-W18-CRE-05]
MSVWMATGYPQQAARVEAGEKQSGQPRLCTYVMREQGVAINHQKRGIQAESIAVNVFPDGANIVRYSSQIFPCDYGFHKKFQVFSAICILGLEYIHSNPRFLVGQKGASGWIFLFFTTLRKSNIGWILRRALSRVNPTPHLLPASTMSECAAHTRPCLVLLEYHCRPCGLLWSTTSLHG